MATFEETWQRIKSHEGEEFLTKSGKPFTYSIAGDIFRSSRAEQNIHKTNFEMAFAMMPIGGPGEINDIVRGPAYVWAVLHDKRIKF